MEKSDFEDEFEVPKGMKNKWYFDNSY